MKISRWTYRKRGKVCWRWQGIRWCVTERVQCTLYTFLHKPAASWNGKVQIRHNLYFSLHDTLCLSCTLLIISVLAIIYLLVSSDLFLCVGDSLLSGLCWGGRILPLGVRPLNRWLLPVHRVRPRSATPLAVLAGGLQQGWHCIKEGEIEKKHNVVFFWCTFLQVATVHGHEKGDKVKKGMNFFNFLIVLFSESDTAMRISRKYRQEQSVN